MDDEPARKKLRKGTKSCIECRRRKIRCTWTSEHDSTCDGCLARNLSCRSQELAGDSDTEPSTSRDRLGRVERRLEHLSDRVKQLERSDFYSVDRRVSGDKESDVPHPDLPGGNPTHIRSLFEGAFVETGASVSRRNSPSPPPRSVAAEHDALRRDLMRLVPSDRDVRLMLQFAVDWWGIVDTGMPALSIDSKHELRAVHERIKRPKCEPGLIAMWLATAAITVQQMPPDMDRYVFDDPNQLRDFPERVLNRVEYILSTRHEIAATMAGIEGLCLLVKLQLNVGQVRKAWLHLRMAIAYAELSGFPELVRSPDAFSNFDQIGSPSSSTDPEGHAVALKGSVWLQLCVLERLLGALLNLPSTTRSRPAQLPHFFKRHNGHGREVFWKLSNLAIKIRDRDELFAYSAPDALTETAAVERELQSVADMGNIPLWVNSPWEISEPGGNLPLLHQHMYFYVLLRTHLPLMLHADSSSQQSQRSYILALYAAHQMGRVYMLQVNGPNHGLFPIRLADFMAFTAIAILMLDREGVLRQGTQRDPRVDPAQTARLVEELVAALEEAGRQDGRVIAAQGVKAIYSIRKTLAMNDAGSPSTTIRVPLLGTMRVRRREVNDYPQQTLHTPVSTHGLPDSSSMPQQLGNSTLQLPGTSRPIPGGIFMNTQANFYPSNMQQAPNTMAGTLPVNNSNGMQPATTGVDDGPWADWIAEAMTVADAGTTQDALWLWDDTTFGL